LSSYYRVYDASGKCTVDASKGQGCYGSYTHGGWKGNRIVELDVLKTGRNGYGGTPFTREQVKEYVIGLTNAGFPCWLREENTKYVITLDERHYYNFSHVRTMLDYARTLWEGVTVPRYFFQLPKEYRDSHDFFMLVQAVSVLHRITEGYPVPSGNYKAVIPTHELMKFFRTHRNHHSGCLKVWYELREGGEKANIAWETTKMAPFIREVRDMLAGKKPKQLFDTLTRPAAPAPSESFAAAAVRKLVRRRKPAAAAMPE
jgi:hypothetical protein